MYDSYSEEKPKNKTSTWLTVCLGIFCLLIIGGGVIFAIDRISQGTTPSMEGKPDEISATKQSPKPDLKATVVVPQQKINFGADFDVIVKISNYGQGPALNTSLYVRVNPDRLVTIRASTLLGSGYGTGLGFSGRMFQLGDIYPNNEGEVRITYRAPTQTQVEGLQSQNIDLRFTCNYYYNNVPQPEQPAGGLVISIDTGTILNIAPYNK